MLSRSHVEGLAWCGLCLEVLVSVADFGMMTQHWGELFTLVYLCRTSYSFNSSITRLLGSVGNFNDSLIC